MDGVPLHGVDGADVAGEGGGLLLEVSLGFAVAGNNHTELGTDHEFGRLDELTVECR